VRVGVRVGLAVGVGVILGVGVTVEVGVRVGVLLAARMTTVGWGVLVESGVALGMRVGASVGVTSGTDKLQAASRHMSRNIALRRSISPSLLVMPLKRSCFLPSLNSGRGRGYGYYKHPRLAAIDDCLAIGLRPSLEDSLARCYNAARFRTMHRWRLKALQLGKKMVSPFKRG